jgi:hypothetical protein
MQEDEGICMHNNRLVKLSNLIGEDGKIILGAYIEQKEKIIYTESAWFKIDTLTNIVKPPSEKWGVMLKLKRIASVEYRMDNSIFNSEEEAKESCKKYNASVLAYKVFKIEVDI